MPEQRLRKLGVEKTKVLTEDFDKVYEVYRKKALEAGYEGEIKFIREHGRVFIYVVI